MIPTKNKFGFKQYIKDKTIKWGIKTFILCESNSGYIVNAEVYTGKVDDDISNLALSGYASPLRDSTTVSFFTG